MITREKTPRRDPTSTGTYIASSLSLVNVGVEHAPSVPAPRGTSRATCECLDARSPVLAPHILSDKKLKHAGRTSPVENPPQPSRHLRTLTSTPLLFFRLHRNKHKLRRQRLATALTPGVDCVSEELMLPDDFAPNSLCTQDLGKNCENGYESGLLLALIETGRDTNSCSLISLTRKEVELTARRYLDFSPFPSAVNTNDMWNLACSLCCSLGNCLGLDPNRSGSSPTPIAASRTFADCLMPWRLERDEAK